MGNTFGTSQSISVQLLIKQGSNWYATSTVYSNATSYADAAAFVASPDLKTFNFTLDAAAWRDFTLTPTVGMSLGSVLTANLTSNTIDGIGFYVIHTGATTSTLRIDNLMVEGVPEPSSALVASLGALGLLRRRRAGR